MHLVFVELEEDHVELPLAQLPAPVLRFGVLIRDLEGVVNIFGGCR